MWEDGGGGLLKILYFITNLQEMMCCQIYSDGNTLETTTNKQKTTHIRTDREKKTHPTNLKKLNLKLLNVNRKTK